jgi:hypothetical protein
MVSSTPTLATEHLGPPTLFALPLVPGAIMTVVYVVSPEHQDAGVDTDRCPVGGSGGHRAARHRGIATLLIRGIRRAMTVDVVTGAGRASSKRFRCSGVIGGLRP